MNPIFGRIYIIQGRRNSVNRTKVIESLNVFKGIYFMSADGTWWGGSLATAFSRAQHDVRVPKQ